MPSFECWMCGHHLPDWKNDFDGMRDMQSKFMYADHKWRELYRDLERMRDSHHGWLIKRGESCENLRDIERLLREYDPTKQRG